MKMPEMRGKRSSQKSAKGSCEGRNGVSGRRERESGERRAGRDEGGESERAGMPLGIFIFLVGILGLTFGGWFLYRMELDSYMGESLIWELFLI